MTPELRRLVRGLAQAVLELINADAPVPYKLSDSEPASNGRLSNAEKCRRYRAKRHQERHQNGVVSGVATPSKGVACSSLLKILDLKKPEREEEIQDLRNLDLNKNTESARDTDTDTDTVSRHQKSAAATRGTRMPSAASGQEALTAWCAKWQIDWQDPDWADFRDWAQSSATRAAVKLDWSAAWRNWKRRRAAERTPRAPPPRPAASGGQVRLWQPR